MDETIRHQEKPTLAMAGASGFVGKHVIEALKDRYQIIALTRSASREEVVDPEAPVRWRRCDLFSLADVKRGLAGADYAIYLVHSMSPSSRLTQAKFQDLDLLLADNFARAAEHNGVKQILYLGGLIERNVQLSRHLASRLEVNESLRSRSTPVTSLQAGLVLGPGGSSSTMLVNLVRRLPVMVLPRWTESKTQAIAIWDVVRAMEMVLGNPDHYGKTYDLGHPQVLTYHRMIELTANTLKLKRTIFNVPVRSPKLSTMWCKVFSGAPYALVSPLIESLKHDLVAEPNWLNDQLTPKMMSFEEALTRSIDPQGRVLPSPRQPIERKDIRIIRQAKRVRSVQRVPVPDSWSGKRLSTSYAAWLHKTFRGLLDCRVDQDGVMTFSWRWPRLDLIQMIPIEAACTDCRQVLRIVGGALVKRKNQQGTRGMGRLEFRLVLDQREALVAIHDYSPQLPWYFYIYSQAIAHYIVMMMFRRHLAKRVRLEAMEQNVTVSTA